MTEVGRQKSEKDRKDKFGISYAEARNWQQELKEKFPKEYAKFLAEGETEKVKLGE